MKTTLKASLLALSIAALPFPAQSAGLGRITVFSALGQPLRAEVELVASKAERQDLRARIPGPDAFKQASLTYTQTMTDIRVAVGERGGKPVLKLSSTRPVNDPFVQMLVELDWASGRMLRDFTFLLDPPAQQQNVQAAVSTASTRRSGGGTAKPAAPAGGAAGGTHRIQQGDTLHSIATQNKPAGVNLDQMLVAIFRANPGAFDGNMNRMRAGRILTLPDASTAAAVPPAQARQEVLAQSESFNTYRKRLAGSAVQTDANADTRSAGGKITPKVEETQPATTAPKDVVKVAPTTNGGKAAGDSGRLQSLEADLAAREKSLEDANSRIAELEKSIKDLQALLELRSRNMATAQQQAEAAGKPAAEPPAAAAPAPVETKPEPAPAPEASKPETAANQPEVAAPVEPPKPAPKPVVKKPALKPAAPVEETSFIDSLLENPMLPAAGGGVLVLLLGGLWWMRRRRDMGEGAGAVAPLPSVAPQDGEQPVFSTSGGQDVDTSASSSVVHTDFSQGDPTAIDTDEGVDPVAEADVYMAYGRDAQAEEILVDALKNDPSRTAIHLKLLDIYAQREDRKGFETTAGELYALTSGKGDEWAKAAALGAKLDPENPLYKGEGATAATPTEAAPAAAASAEASGETVTEREVPLEEESLTFDLPGETPVASAAETTPEAEEGLSFDLPDVSLAPEQPAAPAAAAKPAEDHSSEETVLDFDLNFDAEDVKPAATPAAPEQQPAMDSTLVANIRDLTAEEPAKEEAANPLEGLNFDLELPGSDTAQAPAATPAAEASAAAPSVPAGIHDLEFDLNLEEPAAEAKTGETAVPDLSGISLDFGHEETPAAEAPGLHAADVPGEGDTLEQVETKLELARAYEEMGDKEGARELLEEVLAEGSDAQKAKAKAFLERLSA